jgi:hypothetical protein
MVDSTDLTAYATIILAIATFFLAYYTYKSVKTSESLAKNTQTQTDIILAQQKPQLTSEITYHIDDIINIDVTNHGPGSAYDIALECNFFVTEFYHYPPKMDIDVKNINVKITDEHRTFFQNRTDDEIKKVLYRMGFLGRYNPVVDPPIYDENFKIKSKFPRIENLIRKTNKFYNYERLYPASCIIFLKNAEKRSVG